MLPNADYILLLLTYIIHAPNIHCYHELGFSFKDKFIWTAKARVKSENKNNPKLIKSQNRGGRKGQKKQNLVVK